MIDEVLQAQQFFEARAAARLKHRHDGDDEDERDEKVRENPAHQNVFHRPD